MRIKNCVNEVIILEIENHSGKIIKKKKRAKKLKVEIYQNKKKYNFIPRIPFGLISFISKIALTFAPIKDDNSKVIKEVLKREVTELLDSLKYYEPFLLADIEDGKEGYRIIIKTK